MSRLENNIRLLYKVFENYKGNPDMVGSSNYDDVPKWNKSLFSKSLKELNEDDLSRFCGKVITTWGDSKDLRHFLPRILELTANYKSPYDIWILFDRLQMAGWQNWPRKEREAVQEYMLSLWEFILNHQDDNKESEFEDYFLAVANFYPKTSDLIGIWERSNSKKAWERLASFILINKESMGPSNTLKGFKKVEKKSDEFLDWLISNRMRDMLLAKYFEWDGDLVADRIFEAEEIVSSQLKIQQAETKKVVPDYIKH